MVSLSSIENPLFVGLQYKDDGEYYINKIKTKELTPYDLIQEGVIAKGVREIIFTETAEDTDDIKKAGSDRANYSRITEWQVDDINPVLVHLWVTVSWIDPKNEFPPDKYILETILSP